MSGYSIIRKFKKVKSKWETQIVLIIEGLLHSNSFVPFQERKFNMVFAGTQYTKIMNGIQTHSFKEAFVFLCKLNNIIAKFKEPKGIQCKRRYLLFILMTKLYSMCKIFS